MRVRESSRWAFVLAVGLQLAAAAAASGGQAPEDQDAREALWSPVDEASLGPPSEERALASTAYRTHRLNEPRLLALLARAPMELTEEAGELIVTMQLPWPDGSVRTFRIEQSPIMEPGLAAQFPELTTYRGQGLDDATATVRFDWSPAGLHAMVLSAEGTVFVDPYSPGDTRDYITYYRRDYRRTVPEPFRCVLSPWEEPADLDRLSDEERLSVSAAPHGTTLRTYRLAVAATGEYTAFNDGGGDAGTVAGAMRRITTTMNRVNGVYEHDLAVRMVLVANNASIVYTNAATDPYTNNNGVTMLSQNQSNVDSVIGSANYDVGHVFSTGGGGVANLRVPCVNGSKARGVTGSGSPVGDGFDVDYVAHEMGHQFGANHTFNGTTGSCGGGNRAASTAFEPGSGATIMAYAGICGAEDLQPHSDAYFHGGSLDEIISFITTGSGNNCDVESATGNTPPAVNAGIDYTVPSRTPFTLLATGSDANGDTLAYCWEEMDLGAAAPPNTDNGNRPIFRSFTPAAAPARTLPQLSDILGNLSTFGESLPTTTRTMRYRVTARDNRAGGGGTSSDEMFLSVRADAGPFVVTQPNTAVTWTGGSSQVVAWNVANTSASPVNCANVGISLSLDGGLTYPMVLAASTANDGSESIVVPNVSTLQARIKVAAVGNVFFDVSDQNFTIQAGGTPVIALGQTLQGTLSSSAPAMRCLPGTPSNRYQFSLAAPTTITIDAVSAAFDSFICLVDSANNAVASDDNSGSGSNARLSMTNLVTGTYFIEVATRSAGNQGGVYSLSLATGFPPGTPISLGQTLSGNLASTAPESRCVPNTPSDRYQFALSSPTTITVDAGSGAFDTFLCILNAQNAFVASDDNLGAGSNARLSLANLAPGAYYIEVATRSAGNQGGAYSLSLAAGFPPGTPIVVGQNVSGNLASTAPESRCVPNTPADRYQFALASPSNLVIDAPSTAFDTFLCLLNGANAFVASDDNSGGGTNAHITQTNLAAGSYFVEVATRSAGNAGGAYTLRLSVPAAPGVTVSPTSGLVTTEAGASASFTVVLNSTPSANVTIALSSSDPTEGTVSPASLTFTPANALTPRTVTVTGVDDAVVDGPIVYTVVTAPASSADGTYNGFNAADVSVRNDDNDAAVGWANAHGVTASGNSLIKLTRRGWGNAGASSSQSLAAGAGSVQFTATESNTLRTLGLSRGDSNQSWEDIDFSIYLTEDGRVQVYEAGVSRGQFGTYAAGDRFEVAVRAGVVQYARNGAVFYTSALGPTYPLLVDTAFYTAGATLTNVIVSGF